MDLPAQLRDRYYHLLLRLIDVREVQHWVNNRVKLLPVPPTWMLHVLQARTREGVLLVIGRELGPYVPMNYYSILGSMLFRFKAAQIDVVGLIDRLETMTAYDPDDNELILSLQLEISYIRDGLLDGACEPNEARAAVIAAFERCEEDILAGDAKDL